MKRVTAWRIVCVVAALGAATTGSAVGEVGRDVSYMNGGIGQEEADALRAEAARFPLEIQFVRLADGHEEFVADVAIRISDRAGRIVLDLPRQGPMFLVRLPDGEYTVDVQHDGQLQTRRVVIAQNVPHQKLAFVWG